MTTSPIELRSNANLIFSRHILLDLRSYEEGFTPPCPPRSFDSHDRCLYGRNRTSFSYCIFGRDVSQRFQAACLIRVPTEVVKSRTQTSTYGALGQSSFQAAKLTLAYDGWRGFYRGFGSTIMREVRIARP